MPKIVNHDEYREELLHKAFGLFARKGYSKVTIREIAKELGVSTGTLYHYFENKDVLFEQMVRLLVREDVKELRLMEVQTRIQSPERIIEVLFQFIQSKEFYFQSVVLMVCDVYRYNEEGHSLSVLKDCLGIYRNAISQHLDLGNKDLENMLLSIVIGTIFQRMLDPEEIKYCKVSDVLEKLYPFLATGLLFETKKTGIV
ncbi:MAG: TetR/AcrR family transcriptional regulator [Leptospiraceae bacterium]|jgi:AcrR family transcriptional regulator|nr:TetR/AcrR family transcriptional regulator [Leptospiraceae bacterium]